MHGAFAAHMLKLVLVWFGIPAGPHVEPRFSATIQSVSHSAFIHVSVMTYAATVCKQHGPRRLTEPTEKFICQVNVCDIDHDPWHKSEPLECLPVVAHCCFCVCAGCKVVMDLQARLKKLVILTPHCSCSALQAMLTALGSTFNASASTSSRL